MIAVKFGWSFGSLVLLLENSSGSRPLARALVEAQQSFQIAGHGWRLWISGATEGFGANN
jgi:hypothetical protein